MVFPKFLDLFLVVVMFISDKLSLSFEFHVFMQILFLYFSVFFKNLLLSWITIPFKLLFLIPMILL